MSKGRIQTFVFENQVVAYRTFGSGPARLLAFHGFGQTGSVFVPLESGLTRQFTVFAIDLFFHGDSTYDTDRLLTRQDWCRMIDAFLQAHGINRFSLLGFSLGGRFALTIVDTFAARIDQLFLIAPDGITRNGWYRLATATATGRKLFRYVLHHMPLLLRVGQALVKTGLLERSLLRFAELSLSNPAQRTLAYRSWTEFREIQPDLVTTADRLNSTSVQIHFFTGAFDLIVPGLYILPLTRKLHRYQWTSLEARHNHLIERAGAILANAG